MRAELLKLMRVLTNGVVADMALDLFEMLVQPRAAMPVAYHHERSDETVYGLTSKTTWRIAGKDVAVGPGQTIFIPRRVSHHLRNNGNGPAAYPTLLTPDVLGPKYFREMAFLAEA